MTTLPPAPDDPDEPVARLPAAPDVPRVPPVPAAPPVDEALVEPDAPVPTVAAFSSTSKSLPRIDAHPETKSVSHTKSPTGRAPKKVILTMV